MTASLYQSASTAGSGIVLDMRLTVGATMDAAQSLKDVATRRPCHALLLRERHGVRGDALPFAVPFHPRVGETIRVRKRFPRRGLAAFPRDARDDGNVRSERVHGNFFRDGGLVDALVGSGLRQQGRFAANLPAG